MKKKPYALDSYIIRSSKNPKKFRVVYGKKDMAFLHTESVVKKTKEKLNGFWRNKEGNIEYYGSKKFISEKKAELGNRKGERYYIKYIINPEYLGVEKIKKSRYYLYYKVAERIALTKIRNNNNINAFLYKEILVDNEWIENNKEQVYI